MRHLQCFNNFKINEAILKYDKSIIEELSKLRDLAQSDVPEWMIEYQPGSDEIDQYKSISKELTSNKSKIINSSVSEFIYTNSHKVMKGMALHKALIDSANENIDKSLMERINAIMKDNNNIDYKNEKIKIEIKPFLHYCYDESLDKFKEINGLFNPLPDLSSDGKFFNNFKLFKDYYRDSIFPCQIYFCVRLNKESIEETFKHEMMHLTQCINSLFLSVYKRFSKINENEKYLNKSIIDFYNEVLKDERSVGLVKKKFVNRQDYVSSTVDVDKYMDNAVEYKTQLYDHTVRYYKDSKDKKDVNKIALDVIKDKDIKMIDVPNKQKMSDIMRILYKISSQDKS